MGYEGRLMADQSFTIPGQLPTLNAVLAATKRHWSAYASVKKSETNKVHWIAKGELKPATPPVHLVFAWTTKDRRMDLDNVSHGQKYVIDGLVHANILPDDTRKTVASILHKFTPPDPKSPRVTIEIIEIDEKKKNTYAGPLEKSEQF